MNLTGRIHENCPVVRARVKEGVLIVRRAGPEELLVDTGFTGAIALPARLLSRLRLTFIAVDTFTLATGEAVDLPAYAGVVRIGRRRVRTWFIPGDLLIGTDFLRSVCSQLSLDFEADSVTLQFRATH